jgi:hypothetical protein
MIDLGLSFDDATDIEVDRIRDYIGANFSPDMDSDGWGEIAHHYYALEMENFENMEG